MSSSLGCTTRRDRKPCVIRMTLYLFRGTTLPCHDHSSATWLTPGMESCHFIDSIAMTSTCSPWLKKLRVMSASTLKMIRALVRASIDSTCWCAVVSCRPGSGRAHFSQWASNLRASISRGSLGPIPADAPCVLKTNPGNDYRPPSRLAETRSIEPLLILENPLLLFEKH